MKHLGSRRKLLATVIVPLVLAAGALAPAAGAVNATCPTHPPVSPARCPTPPPTPTSPFV